MAGLDSERTRWTADMKELDAKREMLLGRGLHSSTSPSPSEPFLTLNTSPTRLNTPSTPALNTP